MPSAHKMSNENRKENKDEMLTIDKQEKFLYFHHFIALKNVLYDKDSEIRLFSFRFNIFFCFRFDLQREQFVISFYAFSKLKCSAEVMKWIHLPEIQIVGKSNKKKQQQRSTDTNKKPVEK